ncbi:MAG: DUF2316 family protein [Lactobacillus sp.]|nr:MAG: DUF2316 family protein [Lactobacillus sp.]
MSLTVAEKRVTKKELQRNLILSGLSEEQVARDLKTSPKTIQNILQLKVTHIEDPWILKSYLEEQILDQQKNPLPFTALKGDYHQYWFLDSRRIERRRLG